MTSELEDRTEEGKEPSDASRHLFVASRKALGNALFRALQVAGETDDEYPERLTQEALASSSKVARSTIAKYVDAKDKDDSTVNPDLRTLCKLARALNIPPALLLMTRSDWSKLAQAATFLQDAVRDPRVQQITQQLAKDRPGAGARGKAGLQLAERLGVYRAPPDPRLPLKPDALELSERWATAQKNSQRRQRLGILVATSIPPLGELDASQYSSLLSLCANLGASTQLNGDDHD